MDQRSFYFFDNDNEVQSVPKIGTPESGPAISRSRESIATGAMNSDFEFVTTKANMNLVCDVATAKLNNSDFSFGSERQEHQDFQVGNTQSNAHLIREIWITNPCQAFDAWLQRGMGGKGFKERSQIVYRAMWKKLVKHANAHGYNPAFMNVKEMQIFLDSVHVRSSALPSPTQQRRYLALLLRVQDSLVHSGCLKNNAARELINKKPMQEVAFLRSLPVSLLPSQEESIKAWAEKISKKDSSHWRSHRDAALVCMVLGSGVKLHELQALTLSSILIKNPNSNDPMAIRIHTNGHKERRAPLATSLEGPVLRWMIWLREQGAPDDLPLFLSSDDEQAGAIDPSLEIDLAASISIVGTGMSNDILAMSSAQIWRVVHKTFIDCGFDERLARHGPTVLRNTFATRQLRAGVPLETVSLWLGHKDTRSTEVYRSLLVEPGALSVI